MTLNMVIRMSFPFGHSVSCINEDTQQRRFPPFLSSRQENGKVEGENGKVAFTFHL